MNNIYMAPLQGLTDHIYRSLHADLFSSLTKSFTPFLDADSHSKVNRKVIERKISDRGGKTKLVAQLLSKDGERLAQYVSMLNDFGIEEVNLNLGCPFPTVTGKGRGSKLLQYPAKLDQVLDYYFAHSKTPLSLKVRTGFTSSNEIVELIPVLNNYPLHEIIIHPRTAKQMYEGSIDFNTVQEISENINAPLIYNGNIFSYQDYVETKTKLPDNITGIMLGRGLIMRPYLPDEIINGKEYSIAEQKKLSFALFTKLCTAYSDYLSGDTHFLQKMKAVSTLMLQGLSVPEKKIKKIFKLTNRKKFLEKVTSFYC